MDKLPEILAAAAIASTLAGATLARVFDRESSWRVTMAVAAAVLALTVSGTVAFFAKAQAGATDSVALAPGAFGVDELSILLLPFTGIVFALAVLIVPRAQRSAGFCARVLSSEAIVLATFCCMDARWLAPLWFASMVPAYLETRAAVDAHSGAARVVLWYLGASAALFFAGSMTAAALPDVAAARVLSVGLLLAAILIRKGIIPLHSWMPEFFDRVPLATAVLFSVPQLGAYALVRHPLLAGSQATLVAVGTLALATAVYAAGMAIAQREARRAVAWLFMSESALVLAGFECRNVAGVTGGLSLWISSGLSLAGFILTLWVLEARRGRLSLERYHGGQERMPMLAASFLLLGLASVGLPGTIGFVSEELLNEGAVESFPQIGIAAVFAATLNAITVLRLYFILFCGRREHSTTLQRLRRREAFGFAALVALLVAGGLWPRPFVASRERAAMQFVRVRGIDGEGAGAWIPNVVSGHAPSTRSDSAR